MLDALRFVQGAVHKNGITPELEHFRIKDGRIVGFNGYMALCAPIALSFDVTPKATTFHKALQACGDSITIDRTAAGRLKIRSGDFTAFVPCLDTDAYDAQPEGETYPAPAGMAETFARMLPFVGDDASRPWAMGLALGGGCYTATNNVILLQVWDGHQLPAFNCPRFAVAEIARLKENPVSVQLCDHSVTFHFSGGRWLRSQLLAQEWPTEKMNSILERPFTPQPLPAEFFDAVERLRPFIEGQTSPLYMTNGMLATDPDGHEKGSSIEFDPPMPLPEAAFMYKALHMLRDEVTGIDLDLHPSPCLFVGPNSRGALIGMSF